MDNPWNVLVVEDSAQDYERVVHILREAGRLGAHRQVDDMNGLMDALSTHSWDAVLYKYKMGGMELESCVALLEEFQLGVPLIVVSGGLDAEEAMPLLRLGVSDFVSHDAYARLLPCIERCVAEASERTGRQQAESELSESRRFARLTLDALSTHIAVLDSDGWILAVNKAWRDFATENGIASEAVSEGVNYLAVCDRANSSVGTLIREVVSGESREAGYEYPCHSPSEERWFHCKITRFSDEGPVRIVVDHKNTTALKRADMEMRRRESQLLAQRNALISLSGHSPGRERDITQVLHAITEIGARTSEVARLSIWKLSDARTTISCLDLYDAQSNTHIDGMELAAQDYPRYFSAMLEGQLVAVSDAMQDPMTREFAAEYFPSFGIASILVVPIHLGGITCGVLCNEHVGSVRYWNSDEKTFALAIANQVSIVLEQWERRQAEEDLRLHNAALNATSNGVLIARADGAITWANPAFLQMSGYERDEVLGKRPFGFVDSKSYRPDFFEQIWLTVQSGGTWSGHVTCRRKDGTTYTESQTISPIRDKADHVTHVVVIKEDVTERIGAEKKLWKARERLDRAIDAGNIVLWEWDLATDVVEHSEQWARGSDYTGGVAFQSMDSWLAQVHRDDVGPLRQMLEDCSYAPGKTFQKEFRSANADGSYSWHLLGALAETEETGKIARFIGTVMDITDRKRLEVEYRQAQKMECVGRLAGGVAHDFNNLLGVIGGYSEFALEELEEADPLRENLVQIKRAAERAADLTRQLLAFSRRQILQPEVVDLAEVVTGTEKMLRRVIGEDIRLELDFSEDLGQIMADPGQLEQILMNLIVNARDAMPRGGRLWIETRNVELDEAAAAQRSGAYAGSYVSLRVRDTGSGMDQRTADQIFEPFFTTKEKGKGTGLGLATVYGIVKQSGGSIWVESEMGQGTAFEVLFPRIDGTVTTHRGAEVPSELARGDETILLIEDEDALRAVTRTLLSRMGYTVVAAENGDKALALYAQDNLNVDVVLSDVVMPGKSGPETVERLREMKPELKVLFMSGYAADTIALHGAMRDDDGFINKPFSFAQLTQRLRKLLDSESSTCQP